MILPRLIQPVAVLQTTVLFRRSFLPKPTIDLQDWMYMSRSLQNIICTSAWALRYYAKFEKACTHWKLKCKITDSYIVSFQATFKIFKLMNLISLQAITTVQFNTALQLDNQPAIVCRTSHLYVEPHHANVRVSRTSHDANDHVPPDLRNEKYTPLLYHALVRINHHTILTLPECYYE